MKNMTTGENDKSSVRKERKERKENWDRDMRSGRGRRLVPSNGRLAWRG